VKAVIWNKKGTSGGSAELESVTIGNQLWTTKNLVLTGGGSTRDPSLDEAKYGSLLSFEEARASAPQGWHLPTVEEWNLLNASISRSLDSKKMLVKEFRLVLFKDHASFWTATVSTSGTYVFVASASRFSWDEGNYLFALEAKNHDLYRSSARYVHD
jgi:uncharacterized protein (TIGR02145 family)